MTRVLATAPLPDHDELLRRLVSVDDTSHMINGFYPHITKAAGRELTGMGVVMLLHLAVADYTADFPSAMSAVVLLRLEAFTRAVVTDPTVLADALDALRTLGLADRR